MWALQFCVSICMPYLRPVLIKEPVANELITSLLCVSPSPFWLPLFHIISHIPNTHTPGSFFYKICISFPHTCDPINYQIDCELSVWKRFYSLSSSLSLSLSYLYLSLALRLTVLIGLTTNYNTQTCKLYSVFSLIPFSLSVLIFSYDELFKYKAFAWRHPGGDLISSPRIKNSKRAVIWNLDLIESRNSIHIKIATRESFTQRTHDATSLHCIGWCSRFWLVGVDYWLFLSADVPEDICVYDA